MNSAEERRHKGVRPAALEAAPPAGLYTPLKLALLWLGGTFLAFLALGKSNEVTNMGTLVFFVGATLALIACGYIAKVKAATRSSWPTTPSGFSQAETRSAKWWIVAGSTFYALMGLGSLATYGLDSPAEIVSSMLNPGSSYFIRLRVAEDLSSLGSTDTLTRITTLLAALTTPVIPFLVLYWSSSMGSGIRIVASVGVGIYATYWLAIGTLKGLGDIVIFAGSAALILAKGSWPRSARRVKSKQTVLVAILGIVFAAYMVVNQDQRLTAGQISGYEPNPVVAEVVGERAARGLAVTISYPTHGYLGLSKNLDTPFVWSEFRGSSRVIDSYLEQYTGSPLRYDSTYPARTEQRTGYPALMYWSTIYPWLASDLTFPGAALMMAVVGWWLAKLWIEAAYLRRRLSVLLFAQFALLIAYIPANNQIGLTRPGLIAFASLSVIYGLLHLNRWIGRNVVSARFVAVTPRGPYRPFRQERH